MLLTDALIFVALAMTIGRTTRRAGWPKSNRKVEPDTLP